MDFSPQGVLFGFQFWKLNFQNVTNLNFRQMNLYEYTPPNPNATHLVKT